MSDKEISNNKFVPTLNKPLPELSYPELEGLIAAAMKELSLRSILHAVNVTLAEEFKKTSGYDPTSDKWTKVVTGLDKSQHGGYSLEGNFVDAKKEVGISKNSVIVNCSLTQDQEKVYRLFFLNEKGKVNFVKEASNIKELWEEIENLLLKTPATRVPYIGKLVKIGKEDREFLIDHNRPTMLKLYAQEIALQFSDLREELEELLLAVKDLKEKGKNIEYFRRDLYDSLMGDLRYYIVLLAASAEIFNIPFDVKYLMEGYEAFKNRND